MNSLLEKFENVDKKLLVMGAGVSLLVVIVAVAAIHRPANDPSHPDGTYWLCQSCGHDFSMSTKALGEFHTSHYGERLPCPKCGSTRTVLAYKCPACGKVYPAHDAKVCPSCGAPAA